MNGLTSSTCFKCTDDGCRDDHVDCRVRFWTAIPRRQRKVFYEVCHLGKVIADLEPNDLISIVVGLSINHNSSNETEEKWRQKG